MGGKAERKVGGQEDGSDFVPHLSTLSLGGCLYDSLECSGLSNKREKGVTQDWLTQDWQCSTMVRARLTQPRNFPSHPTSGKRQVLLPTRPPLPQHRVSFSCLSHLLVPLFTPAAVCFLVPLPGEASGMSCVQTHSLLPAPPLSPATCPWVPAL